MPSNRSFRAALSLSIGLGFTSATAGAAPPPRKTLACAVEGSNRAVRAADLCRELGRELLRPIASTDDVRKTRGEAVQVIRGDVQWIVIWLVDGRVRSWTRVSQIEAAADQLRFIVRAARALASLPPPQGSGCVRVEPHGRHRLRSPELSYPWAELGSCQSRVVDVVDPWWLPEPPAR